MFNPRKLATAITTRAVSSCAEGAARVENSYSNASDHLINVASRMTRRPVSSSRVDGPARIEVQKAYGRHRWRSGGACHDQSSSATGTARYARVEEAYQGSQLDRRTSVIHAFERLRRKARCSRLVSTTPLKNKETPQGAGKVARLNPLWTGKSEVYDQRLLHYGEHVLHSAGTTRLGAWWRWTEPALTVLIIEGGLRAALATGARQAPACRCWLVIEAWTPACCSWVPGPVLDKRTYLQGN